MRKILTDQQTLLLIGRVFYVSQNLGGISLTKLQQLYVAKEQLEENAVAVTVAAMKRLLNLKRLQQQIDYYEDGEKLSKATIQHLEAQINALKNDLNDKKNTLHH